MEITSITGQTLPMFAPFLLPESAELLEAGEPLTALGLLDGGTACGALTGFIDDSLFRIDSLFVAPEYRRRGGASRLLDTLRAAALDSPDVWFIDSVFTARGPEVKTLEAFFPAYGFSAARSPFETVSVTVGELGKAAWLTSADPLPSILPFRELPKAMLRDLDRRVRRYDDLPMGCPTEKADVDPDLSCGLVADGVLHGILLIDRSCCGELTTAFMGLTRKASPKTPFYLTRFAFQAAIARYPADTVFMIHAVNRLTDTVLPRLTESGVTLTPVSRRFLLAL